MNRRNRCFALLALIVGSCTTIYYTVALHYFHQHSFLSEQPKLPYRACIATLVRSDNFVSLNRVLNMLHSLQLYFKNIHRYPIYIFHEPSLASATQDQIRHCASPLAVQFQQIVFEIPADSNRSGYAAMCQFWSYDVWFKYDFLRTRCDYVMRFDDDSYLINSTVTDLFEQFHQQQLDFVYRIIYHDTNGMEFLRENLRTFLPANQTRRGCIESLCTSLTKGNGYDGLAVYNNFFLLRVQVIYQHPIIEEYLKQLIAMNAFHRYPIGDANVQTISLMLVDKPLKVTHWRFPYNHNVHGSSDLHPSFIYHANSALMWQYQMRVPNVTCRKMFMATKHMMVEKAL